MKKTVKIVALALVLVMALACLASCGKTIKGEYEATLAGTIGFNLKFDGKNVAITAKVGGFSSDPINATYEIEDDKITFTIPEDAEMSATAKGLFNDIFGQPATLEIGEEENGTAYIKIGKSKFTAVTK